MPIFYVTYKGGTLIDADSPEDARTQVMNDLAVANLFDGEIEIDVTEVDPQ